jgi:hypothetical protein
MQIAANSTAPLLAPRLFLVTQRLATFDVATTGVTTGNVVPRKRKCARKFGHVVYKCTLKAGLTRLH